MTKIRRARTFTLGAFALMGGSSLILGGLEFGLAFTHLRGAHDAPPWFAGVSALFLIALGTGFLDQARRVWR